MSSTAAVHSAICYRIATQRLDLIDRFGIERVMDEVSSRARSLSDLEEIGSSDISCWVQEIEDSLNYDPLDDFNYVGSRHHY